MLPHPSPEAIMIFYILKMKLGRRPSFKLTSPTSTIKSTSNMCSRAARFYKELTFRINAIARLFPRLPRASKMIEKVKCSDIQVQKQSWFLIKNEAGPKAQLQKDKSNAPTSKSRNNNDVLLKMKLGRRPSFKMTRPTSRNQVHKQYVFTGSQSL